MAQCWYCGKVKGKRTCPARGGELICTRCCGTHRGAAIRCPTDCPYLHGGQDRNWVSETREREMTRFIAPMLALEERVLAFHLFLLHLMNAPQSPLRDLSDADLLETTATATRTLQTLAKGLLYSHPSEKLHLQCYAEWLVKLIASRGAIEGAPQVGDEEVIEALRALAATLEARSREPQRERYLELAERMLGDARGAVVLPEGLEEPPPKLIIAP